MSINGFWNECGASDWRMDDLFSPWLWGLGRRPQRRTRWRRRHPPCRPGRPLAGGSTGRTPSPAEPAPGGEERHGSQPTLAPLRVMPATLIFCVISHFQALLVNLDQGPDWTGTESSAQWLRRVRVGAGWGPVGCVTTYTRVTFVVAGSSAPWRWWLWLHKPTDMINWWMCGWWIVSASVSQLGLYWQRNKGRGFTRSLLLLQLIVNFESFLQLKRKGNALVAPPTTLNLPLCSSTK